ncbi:MAG: hypothetical protein H6R13_2972 [Proteobacteria bacterium]|nr:hypothetical protein [Pseudomonadota bacterium]
MPMRSDSFEILRDCRALYLKHLGALLLDSGIISGSAIRAIQEGAGAYFDEMVSTTRRGSFAEEANGLTSSRITLVGEDDLELGIRLDNLSARLFETTGGSLWKTHLRFVTLLRRPDLPKSNNPIGPKGISEGLMAMFAASGAIGIEQKLSLLDRIESCLLANLPGLYAEINDFLDRGGVEAAQASIVGSQEGPKQADQPATNALLALQQTLLAKLPGGIEPAQTPAGMGGAAASLLSQAKLERLIFRLNELDRQGALGAQFKSATSLSTESLIPELFSGDGPRPALPKALNSAELGISSAATEGLAIDTLAMIFEAIFSEPKLPDALKAAISSLQITLLKVAMKDASLFTDDKHPARLVLDRMGQAVLGLPTDVPARHPVCTRLFEIASSLRSEGSDSSTFQTALAQLDALVAERNGELTEAAEAYLPLLRQLDRRDEAAIQTRHILDKLIEQNPPDTIRTFMDKSWRKVLQLIWLENGPDSSQWQTHVSAIEELLWTFQPKTDPEERKSLARRLPSILKLLKTGMERIGLPAEAQEAFLDDCFTLQTQALRATPTPAADAGLTSVIAATGLHSAENEPVYGNIQSGQLILDTLDFSDYQPGPSRSLACAPGDWLELKVDEGETRVARVCYISPNSQRTLLLNPDFAVALAVHPAILDRQLRAGEARISPASSLFELAASRALQRTATH